MSDGVIVPNRALMGQTQSDGFEVPGILQPVSSELRLASTGTYASSRRLQLASLVLGLFVLLDVALFGWLMFRSLSQREIERVLVETRQEAEGLAQRLAGRAEREGEDLFTVTAKEREIQTYIDSVLKQRKFVRSVEVVDTDGKLVFRGAGEVTLEAEPSDSPRLDAGERPSQIETRPFERESTSTLELPREALYDLDIPIGELGFLHVGISQGELQQSIGTLRSELVGKTAIIGVLTAVVLVLAYLIIWRLWQRGLKLEEQAKEAERMAYIGTLASGLAHEIRSPLNSLSLNMQMLEEELECAVDNSGGQRLMSLTRDEIGRLDRLVTDFLSYARPRPLELTEVPAVELLHRCRELLAAEVRSRGARLEIEDPTGGATIRVDAEQIAQMLLNLVHNALASSEESGHVNEVCLRVRQRRDHVVLEVEDRGTGLSEEERQKIFDLFYSTRKGGTGLGLAVVQRIAQNHGAEIEVDSELGRGTIVRLVLPAA